jgi:hypothetical protein
VDAIGEIYAVSGGSILAAHMMAYWDKYTGSEEEFAAMERAIFDFADSNLRDRVLRRAATQKLWNWLFFFLPSRFTPAFTGAAIPGSRRAHWLIQQYRVLFGPDTMADCVIRFPRLPLFHILATSFRSAELCAFTNHGFEVEGRDGTFTPGQSCSVPLADAVAASSAFPPLFPPITFSASILHHPQSVQSKGTILLSDGGIYDNLGVEKYRCRRARGLADTPYRLLISDGGAAFRNDDVASFANVVGRNMRASDVLMDRVARATKSDVRRMTQIDDVVISIHALEESDASGGDHNSPDVRTDSNLFGMVRTDLDRFNPELCIALVQWGQRVASRMLAAEGWTVEASANVMKIDSARTAMLKDAGARRLWTVITSSQRDVIWIWALRGTLLALFTLLVVLPIAGISSFVTDSINEAKSAGDRKVAEKARELVRTNGLLDQYSSALQEVGEKLSSNKIAEAQAIITRRTGILFDQTVRAQETFSAFNVPSAAPSTSGVGAAAAVSESASIFPQRVYIQFAGSFTRAQITDLNSRLRQTGWNMQSTSGERTGKAAGINEVRFGPGSATAAAQLADTINGDPVRPGQAIIPVPMQIIGPNSLEVWMSN